MTPSLPNAFNEPEVTPYRSLAAALSPLQAALARTESGWRLALSPMRTVQVLAALADSDDDEAYDAPDREPHLTIVYDVEQDTWRDGDEPLPLAAIARRLSIEPVESFGEDVLVLDDERLLALGGLLPTRRLRAVRMTGPVEEADVQAVLDATARSESPLTAELRATAAVTIDRDRHVTLDVRDRTDALALVAENMRHYLAAVLRQPAHRFEAPVAWQIERLMSVSGALVVRPIETEIFSTSVDVGISTSGGGEPQPADRSLVYDRPSGTWHDEE